MIIELLYFIWICIIVFYLGHKLMQFSGIRFKFYSELLIFSFGVGFSVLSFMVMGLGMLGFLKPSLFYIIFSIILILFILDIKSIYRIYKIYYRKEYREQESCRNNKRQFNFDTLITGTIIIFVLINFFSSFAPPVEWDSISYHLALPKIYLKEQTVTYVPSMLYSLWPFFTEMLFTVGLFVGDNVPHLFSFLFSVLVLLGIYSFCRRYFTKRTGLISGLIFYSMVIISERASQAMVEIPFAFYSLLGIYSFVIFEDTKKTRFLVLSAVMSGISFSIKFTALIIPLIIGLMMVYDFLKVRRVNIINNMIIFGCISILFGSPWYLRSYFYSGNPFYGLFYNIFGGINLSPETASVLNSGLNSYGFGRDIFSFIILPWNLTIYGDKFGSLLGVTPLFLMFIPLYFFVEKNRIVNKLLFFCFIFITMWFFTSQQQRLLIPSLVFLSIIAGYIFTDLSKKKVLFIFLSSILILTVFFNLIIGIEINYKKISAGIGIISHEEFYSSLKDFNPHDVSVYANKKLPRDSKILLIEPRGFYLDHNYVWGSSRVQAIIDYDKFENKDELHAKLKSMGITHLFINFNYMEFLGGDAGIINLLIKEDGVLIYENNGICLYKIS